MSSVACFSMYPTTGSFKRIEVFKIRMRAIKIDQFNPVHVFLHFETFCLVALRLILASKLSELDQCENWAVKY